MDASQITKLMQKQNTTFINRSKVNDSSTLLWQKQIESSKYIRGVATCSGEKNTNVPTQNGCSEGNGICNFGGSGKSVALMTGSPQRFLNVYSGSSGSGSQIYSSEQILLQKAGNNSCGVPGTNPAPTNSYVILPRCDCTNTNGPTTNNETIGADGTVTVNNNSNPYLPQFDTYYKFKTPSAQCKTGCPDENLKHFVKQCHSRFPNAKNGVSVVCNSCSNSPNTCDNCILEQ
jgi:hypothetical protein